MRILGATQVSRCKQGLSLVGAHPSHGHRPHVRAEGVWVGPLLVFTQPASGEAGVRACSLARPPCCLGWFSELQREVEVPGAPSSPPDTRSRQKQTPDCQWKCGPFSLNVISLLPKTRGLRISGLLSLAFASLRWTDEPEPAFTEILLFLPSLPSGRRMEGEGCGAWEGKQPGFGETAWTAPRGQLGTLSRLAAHRAALQRGPRGAATWPGRVGAPRRAPVTPPPSAASLPPTPSATTDSGADGPSVPSLLPLRPSLLPRACPGPLQSQARVAAGPGGTPGPSPPAPPPALVRMEEPALEGSVLRAGQGERSMCFSEGPVSARGFLPPLHPVT
ncbi:uncharacterized protein LOC133232990 [Bos javanicus]|uniref:uncharacterized protein LOC133232990 n=1 Tax=Bos javanicus TaxID=9906 RepID=UPI002AA69808|nr:uncharacterized protein LOC133232990 [Bos javanicus]